MPRFEYTHLASADSSAINRLAYNENNKTLLVEFVGNNGAVYPGIELSTYEEFVGAPSKGRFYNFNILGEFKSSETGHYYDLVAVERPVRYPGDVLASVKTDEFLKANLDKERYGDGVPMYVFDGDEVVVDKAFLESLTERVSNEKYVVYYNFNNSLKSSFEIVAVNEHLALLEFHKNLETVQTAFPDAIKDVKVTAVTHYFG